MTTTRWKVEIDNDSRYRIVEGNRVIAYGTYALALEQIVREHNQSQAVEAMVEALEAVTAHIEKQGRGPQHLYDKVQAAFRLAKGE